MNPQVGRARCGALAAWARAMTSGPRLRGKHGRAGVAPALAALAAALAPLAVLLLLASFAAAAGPPAGDAATDEALARKEAEVTRLLRDAAAHPVLVRPAAAAAGPAGTGAGNTAHHARKPTYQGVRRSAAIATPATTESRRRVHAQGCCAHTQRTLQGHQHHPRPQHI